MKNKLNKLLILSIVTLFVIACSDSLLENENTNDKLKELNKKINSENLNSIKISNKIENISFFNKIETFKKTKKNDFNQGQNKNIEIKFLPESKLILKDFFNTISLNEEKNYKAITQLYINEIRNLTNDEEVINECLKSLTFIKDTMIYLDFGIDNSNLKAACGHRDCFDCCMYKKADALFNSQNWAEQAMFIYSAAVSTSVWVIDCGWNCI